MGMFDTLNGTQPTVPAQKKRKLAGISEIEDTPDMFATEAPSQQMAAPAPGQVPDAGSKKPPVPPSAEPDVYREVLNRTVAPDIEGNATKYADKYKSQLNEGRQRPSDVKDILARQNELLANPTISGQVEKYQKAIINLDAQIQQKMQEKRDTADRSDMAALGEQLGNAILMIGAGMYGMEKGVNMQGVQFNKTDWERRLANRLGMINEEIQLGREGQKVAQGQLGQVHSDIRDQAKEGFKSDERKLSDFDKETQDINKFASTQGLRVAEEEAKIAEARKRDEIAFIIADRRADKQLADYAMRDAMMEKRFGLQEDAMKVKQHIKDADELVDNLPTLTKAVEMGDDVAIKNALDKTGLTETTLNEQKGPWYNFLIGPSDKELKLKFLDSKLKAAEKLKAELMAPRAAQQPVPAAAPAEKDPDAVKYAEMYKIPYEQAASIISKRKAGN